MTRTTTQPMFDLWFAATALLAAVLMLGANILGAGHFAPAEYALTLALTFASTLGAQGLNRWALRSDSRHFMAIGLLGNAVRLGAVLLLLGAISIFLPLEPQPVFAGVLVGGFVFLMHEVVSLHRLSVRSHAAP